ncbi:uroporphyrinogen-III synthase [Agaribacter marinus]|uniref:Uroporphyrinogen-III synthase n=1 Tax=Agaribacter marinus TaxID=1431249 RepID=A0AA37WH03_9ALTE|nr:uroporphyrinogen-III synthase [Agaribacter marinus]GLR69318.1 hypothetical protein GCM10007852_02260 [Agaribacter marinus]
MFLITRPEPKASNTKNLFESEDLLSCIFPAIVIKQVPNISAPHKVYDYIIVTSTYTLDWLSTAPKPALACKHSVIAIGTATQKALAGKQFPWAKKIIKPLQQNSEGVLSIPELADVSGKHILIVKGRGGRQLLENSLLDNGAKVDVLNVYERQPNHDKKLIRQVEERTITCIIVTSVEIVEQLFASFCSDWLKNKKWIATSQRIADYLHSKRISEIHVSQSADDQIILQLAKTLSKQNPSINC